MREITEKHIIEMIKNNNKWSGANKAKGYDWKGVKNVKRMDGKAHKRTDKKI